MNIVETVEFQDFSIQLEDLEEKQTEAVSLYITDAIVLSEEFDSFIAFYTEHQIAVKYFNTVLNKKYFHGRFGQLIYSEGDNYYFIRLVFVESKYDKNQEKGNSFVNTVVAKDDVEYFNLIELVSKQEVVISKLKDVLESKNILSPAELEEVFTVQKDKLSDVKFKMGARVNDLNLYLKE